MMKMSSQGKMVCLSILLLLALSSCSNIGNRNNNWPATLASRLLLSPSVHEFSYANPPQQGAWLRPQPHLVACKTEQLATTMALTGFFLQGCALLATENTHRVASIVRRDFGDDQFVWMATVDSPDGTVWVPIPWHNWA